MWTVNNKYTRLWHSGFKGGANKSFYFMWEDYLITFFNIKPLSKMKIQTERLLEFTAERKV